MTELVDKLPNLKSLGIGLDSKKAQGRMLNRGLDLLNMHSPSKPSINREPEFRDPAYFDKHLTLGFIGMDEAAIAIVASAGNYYPRYTRQRQVLAMAIVSDETGPHLYRDTGANSLWTDLFWICENNQFRLITPIVPIPIDGLMTIYDPYERDYKGTNTYISAVDHLREISDNKWMTRRALQASGLLVPRGVFVPKEEAGSSDKTIEQFIDTSEGIKGVVVKGNKGSCGIFVKLFGLDEVKQAEDYAQDLYCLGQDVVVEERILPYSDTAANKYFRQFIVGGTDYNFRVLVTLEQDPKKIDAEIRFAPLNGTPVNIHQGAKAVRPVKILPYEIIDKVYRTAEQATYAVLNKANQVSIPQLGVAGVDIIVGQDARNYVIEVNTGHVGGFGTLCRLDGGPLASVADILLPSTREFLLRNFQRREPYNDLHQFPPTFSDLNFVGNMYLANGEFERSRTILLTALNEYPESAVILHNLGAVAQSQKRYEQALDYFQEAYLLEPAIPHINNVLICLRKLRRYEDAEKFLEQIGPKLGENKELLGHKVILMLRDRSKRSEARKLVWDHFDIIEDNYSRRLWTAKTMSLHYLEMGIKGGVAWEILRIMLLRFEGLGRKIWNIGSSLWKTISGNVDDKEQEQGSH